MVSKFNMIGYLFIQVWVFVCVRQRERGRGMCVVDMTGDFSVYIYLQVFIVIYVGLIAQPTTRWLCV